MNAWKDVERREQFAASVAALSNARRQEAWQCYNEIAVLNVEMLEALQNFREWLANHFEDFEPDINGELLCLDNDFAAAIAGAEGTEVHP